MNNLKVVFMGTPDFALPALKWLIENTNVVLVVTKADKEVGRNHEIVYSPVKKLALEHQIALFQPISIKNDYEIISETNPDVIITCAYGQIVPKDVLDIPKFGCLNLHASLLPKYRGAAPIQWALINGEKQTGVSLMYMDEHMDTGNVIGYEICPISDDDDIGMLHDKLSLLGPKLLEKYLPNLQKGNVQSIKQDDEKATYAPMIKREDEFLDFNHKGQSIINKIRAFSPWPLTYLKLNDNEIKVVKAHFSPHKIEKTGKIIYDNKQMGITCEDGIIYLDIIKPMGKKIMTISDFLNGNKKDIFNV